MTQPDPYDLTHAHLTGCRACDVLGAPCVEHRAETDPRDQTASHPDHDGLRAQHLDRWTCRDCDDPRMQRTDPNEPLYTSGAFHVEHLPAPSGTEWMVYDAYEGRARLSFALASLACDAAAAMDEEVGRIGHYEAAFETHRAIARASLGQSAR